MQLYSHQQIAKDNVLDCLSTTPNKIPVLAFATGGGKTVTIQHVIKDYLEKYKNSRVLVLCHNQIVLRDNFLSKNFLDVFEVQSGKGISSSHNQRLVVAIPSTVYKKDIGSFDLLIVDEAHEFYGKSMLNIIKKSIGKHQTILLTASHGKFNNESLYNKELFSVMEGFDTGILTNTGFEVVTCDDIDITYSNYTQTDELSASTTISKEAIIKICEDLDSRMNKHHINLKPIAGLRRYSLPKAIFACHSTEMADIMYRWYSDKYGKEEVRVSYSATKKGRHADVDSAEIAAFKRDDKVRLLFLVRRGILGFDCPELEFVFDLTMSRNVDRTMQLVGRLLRTSRKARTKCYLKIVPDFMEHYCLHQLACVVALFHKENNRKWQGQYMQVPILKALNKKKRVVCPKEGNVSKKQRKKSKHISIEMPILDFSEYKKVFEDESIWESKSIKTERYTTLEMVRKAGLMQVDDSSGKKKQIEEMYFKKGKTPSYKDKLHTAYKRYTTPSSECYDERWINNMKQLYPKAFLKSSDIKKKQLEELYFKKGKTPAIKDKLYRAYNSYTSTSNNAYDEQWTNNMRQLYPKAFTSSADKKNQLEEQYFKKGKTPNTKDKLHTAYKCYVAPSNNAYDEQWTNNMRQLYPKAFLNSSKKQVKLLETGIIYESLVEAAKSLVGSEKKTKQQIWHMSTALGKYIKNKKPYKGYTFVFVEEEEQT